MLTLKRNFGLRKFFAEKMLGPKKILVQKKFRAWEKFVVRQKFWAQKMLVLNKIFDLKKFQVRNFVDFVFLFLFFLWHQSFRPLNPLYSPKIWWVVYVSKFRLLHTLLFVFGGGCSCSFCFDRGKTKSNPSLRT